MLRISLTDLRRILYFLLPATSNVPDDISSWFKCIGSGKTNNTVVEYGHIASDLYVFGTQVKIQTIPPVQPNFQYFNQLAFSLLILKFCNFFPLLGKCLL